LDDAGGQVAPIVEDHFEVMGRQVCPVASLQDYLNVIDFIAMLLEDFGLE
jgi:hypothetical protein